jgi:hypothetical protein
MRPLDSLVVFLASLLIGGLGIHVGSIVVTGARGYGHAVVTAGLGALVWAVVGFFLGGVPLLGPALTFLAYLLVIKRRYRSGWLDAAGVALVAWLAVLVVLYGLASVGVTTFEAVNVPGVPWV